MDATETLSDRGRELAKNNIRDKFSAMFSDVYDAGTNPNGFVNLGVSENVGATIQSSGFGSIEFQMLTGQAVHNDRGGCRVCN